MFVFLTNPLTFLTNVGVSPRPSSKILIMVANEPLICKLWDGVVLKDDEYCSKLEILILSTLLVTTSTNPIDGTCTYLWVSDKGKSSTTLNTPLADTLFAFT